ncbi:hypothetical protein Tco_1459773 [Tanacetum coccineum]
MANGKNIAASKNRGREAFHIYMDEFHGSKIAVSVQWDHRKAISEENSSSPIDSSRNAKILGPRWGTHSLEQQDNPTGMHNGLPQPSNVIQAAEERIKVAIHPEYPEQTIAIGSTLIEEVRKALCNLLRRSLDVFS